MARITFKSGVTVDIDFNDRSIQPSHVQEFYQNESASGKVETINVFGKEEMAFDTILTEITERRMAAWWSWARSGNTFSFALSSSRMSATSVATATGSGTTTWVYLDKTTGFAVGDVCLLKAQDNDDEFELVKIASIKAGVSIASTTNLVYDYNVDDVFRHRDYWPSVVNTEKSYSPTKRGQYYYCTLKFVEAP